MTPKNRFSKLHTDNDLSTVTLAFTRTVPVEGSRFPRTTQVSVECCKVKPGQDVSQIKDLIFTLGTGEQLEIAEISDLAEMEIGQTVKQTDGKLFPRTVNNILPDSTTFKVWNSKITEINYAND